MMLMLVWTGPAGKEGGIRVPGLLVWPEKVSAPLTIDAPCVTSDYFPTVLDALGIPLPDDRIYDGISLLPFLQGDRKTRDRPIGFMNKRGNEAVWMEDQYKLMVTGKQTQLFDIPADPAEEKDLSNTHPEVTARMSSELTKWKEQQCMELPRSSKSNAYDPSRPQRSGSCRLRWVRLHALDMAMNVYLRNYIFHWARF